MKEDITSRHTRFVDQLLGMLKRRDIECDETLALGHLEATLKQGEQNEKKLLSLE